MDSTIYWINYYQVDSLSQSETNCAIQWLVIYSLYSIILLNNWYFVIKRGYLRNELGEHQILLLKSDS